MYYIDQLSRITEKLDHLRDADSAHKVFGASEHQYKLAAPKTEHEISELEARHTIGLPRDYREFLLSVGDGVGKGSFGSAGPGYGLFSIDTISKIANELAAPFPLESSILNVVELDESHPEWPTWSKAYHDSSSGALPLAHYGCGIFANLVLVGEAYGTVWIIDGACGDMAHFADHARFHSSGGGPNLHFNGTTWDGPHSFIAWYEDWLDGALSPSSNIVKNPEYLPGAIIVPARPCKPTDVLNCRECGCPLRTPSSTVF